MPDTPAAELLAEAYTWYSTGLRELVHELLGEAGLDAGVDTVEDLCGDLWLHATEFTATHTLSYTEVLDLLDRNADLLVNRLRCRPEVRLAGRLDTAVDPVDVAEPATIAVGGAGRRALPRPRRGAAECPRPQRAAA
ncbi:hypothetical protein [Kitasatospora sp. NPDC094016]|uniref:hypothetical protein n=1 Tax=Kitasatospora sp. NPDC094016 TaxID=3154986 RepID=UPI00332CAEE4